MATATLELVNPYAKFGLKRRPTYDEIANLISENETLTGTLPNRDATFFKKTPQGSFFDGTDHLELLKEEQNRIMERQMREIILRQSTRTNGTSFNLNRLQSSSSSSSSSTGGSSSSTELQPDRGLVTAGIQADLQRRASQLRSRQQQTGEAHQEEVSRQGRMPTLQGFLSRMSGRQVQQVDSSSSEEEEGLQSFRSISPERKAGRRSKNRKEKSSSSTARASTDALRDIPTITGRFRKS